MPEPPGRIPRFKWNFEPFNLLDLPERYRTLYVFSAATLNLSTSLWAFAAFLGEPNDNTRTYAQAIFNEARLGSIRPPSRDGVQALRHSMLATRELFLLCQDADAVTLPRKRWKRFPRFFLTKKAGSALSQFEFKDFIVGEVRQSAMTLIAGGLQLQEQALATKRNEAPLIADLPAPEADFPKLLQQQIDVGQVPDRHAIVAWLNANTTNYRVRFNLACYFSREILDPVGPYQERDEIWVDRSLDQLEAAIASCPVEEKQSVAELATKDPALVGLRLRGTSKFQDAVGAVGLPWGLAAPVTPLIDDVLQMQILTTLVRDEPQAGRLRDHLVRMRPPSRQMPRLALLDPGNRFVQIVEDFMADQPTATDHVDDRSDREMLARVLFLPEWNGRSGGDREMIGLSKGEEEPGSPSGGE